MAIYYRKTRKRWSGIEYSPRATRQLVSAKVGNLVLLNCVLGPLFHSGSLGSLTTSANFLRIAPNVKPASDAISRTKTRKMPPRDGASFPPTVQLCRLNRIVFSGTRLRYEYERARLFPDTRSPSELRSPPKSSSFEAERQRNESIETLD